MNSLYLIELSCLLFHLTILPLCGKVLGIVFGKDCISEGVEWQSSCLIGGDHIIGQLNITGYLVDVGDEGCALQHWIGDARIELLVGVLPIPGLCIVAVPSLLQSLLRLLVLPSNALLSRLVNPSLTL